MGIKYLWENNLPWIRLIRALDIGDELNADLWDNLLDTVLNEIKSKQGNTTQDSDDQIMPTASPDIHETDLMDDLDTPFHNEDGETSFGSHKNIALCSPVHFQDSWSFDYIDDLSRKNSFLDNSGIQNRDQNNPAGHSYPAVSRASVAADYENSKSASSAASNSTFNKSIDHSNSQLNSQMFDYQNSKYNPSGDISDDAKLNKDFQGLKQYPDFPQLLYTGSSQQRDSSGGNSHHQFHSSSDQAQQHRSRQDLLEDSIFQDEDSNDTTAPAPEFVSWTCKHPENWTEAEVLDWLFFSAERNGVDCSHLHGEAFRTITGRDLCRMGVEEFRSLEPQFGQYFYGLFRQLLNGLKFTQPSDIIEMETHIAIPDDRDVHRYIDSSFSPKSVGQGHQQGDMYYQGPSSSPASPETYYAYPQTRNYSLDYSSSSVYPSQSLPDNQLQPNYGYSSTEQALKYEQGYSYDYPPQSYPLSERSTYRPYKTDKTSVASKYAGVITPRRRPGRPRIKSLPTDEEKRLREEKRLKSQPLWEFIFDLLNNPVYNPQVLKWENQKEGLFRFIQSETIAQLWGNLKNNENMTYEKLSRAMRHYYKRDILERVEGRRLVYKFSMATLQKMREKRQAAYKNASSEIAAVSNVTSHSLVDNMKSTQADVNSNVVFSGDKQIVFMQPTSSSVTSASASAVQFAGSERLHAVPSESVVHFTDDEHMRSMTSSVPLYDVSEQSNLSLPRKEERHLIAIHDMPNEFASPPSMALQNFENTSPGSFQTVYV